MQFKATILAALAATGVIAQDSICDKYTKALLKDNTGANQYTLLTLLVNTAVIGNYTGPHAKGANAKLPGSMNAVPGILAPGMSMGQQVNLLPYFNGKLLSTNNGGSSGVSMNFLDGGGADTIIANATSSGTAGSNQEKLLTHLYQYFGAALGCSQYGKMGFPAYMGVTGQYKVHKYMDLNAAQNNYFIEQVGLAATSFGASMSDVNTVAKLLNTTFNYKCSPPADVLPGAPKELQAICQDSSCPQAPMPTCAAYPAAVSPKMAMAGASGASSMMSGSATMMSGSATMTSGSATMTGSMMASSTASGSSGGAAVNGVNGAVLGVAGLMAAAAAL